MAIFLNASRGVFGSRPELESKLKWIGMGIRIAISSKVFSSLSKLELESLSK